MQTIFITLESSTCDFVRQRLRGLNPPEVRCLRCEERQLQIDFSICSPGSFILGLQGFEYFPMLQQPACSSWNTGGAMVAKLRQSQTLFRDPQVSIGLLRVIFPKEVFQ